MIFAAKARRGRRWSGGFTLVEPLVVIAIISGAYVRADGVFYVDSKTRGAGVTDGLFPFVISYDAPDSATNVSAWLARPAGKHGFVRAEGGRLLTDAGPIRFWATNLCFDACFPEKGQAERVAARLARLGINCVRMHHMDSRSIFKGSRNKLTLNPEQLDKLDYLVFQLKEHGIYTNLNLHVSRWLDEVEGFSGRAERPNYDKGLDNFEPRLIELQKQYARDLLTHVNRYTTRPYAREPAVAFVEINNENALLATWSGGQLDRLPDPYAATFRKLWNAWLRKKYGDTQKLRTAWNAKLRPGGVVGVEPDQKLEDDSVPVRRHGEMNLTEPARNDFVDFLWDTEAKYWGGMYRFLKDELKVKPLVSGTQMGYGPAHIQSRLDYVDAHAYWHHPAFPGRPWDRENWFVQNEALVNHPAGTLGNLAATRVVGKAYTVSEYNHPQPISYAAEGFPMIAAFGALQGWNGIFSFAYCHNANFEPRSIDSFFDIKSDTAKLAHMPACAALFLRGDADEAKKLITVSLSREAERSKLHQTRSARTLNAGRLGLDPRWSLIHRVALDLDPRNADEEEPPILVGKPAAYVSDTGQLRWDVSEKDAGYFTANTPRTRLFTGFVRGRTFELGDVTLRIGKTRLDWATVSMVAIDGRGFDEPGRILIAATGWQQNSDAKLEELGGNRVTLRNRWGREPVLCEGVPAEIVLPIESEKIKLYPLDESGNRRAAVPVSETDGKAVVTLNPKHKTVWYEIEIR